MFNNLNIVQMKFISGHILTKLGYANEVRPTAN